MQIQKSNIKSGLSNIYWMLAAIILVVLISSLWQSGLFLVPKKTKFESKNDQAIPQAEATLFDVLNYFDEGYEVYFSVKDDAAFKLPKDIRKELKKMGGEQLADLQFRESYVAFFENGKFIEEKKSLEDSVSIQIEKKRIVSAGNKAGSFTNFYLAKKKINAISRGLNLFILKKSTSEIYTYNFDFYESETPLLKKDYHNNIGFQLPALELVIDIEDFKKIKAKRGEALNLQILLTADEDFIPAKVWFEGKEYAAETRLKGDWVDHLKGEKWSYRVKLNGGETLMGMRKFSLHHPGTRNYAGEWLFQKLLEKNDMLNLQYHFVNLVLTVPGDPKHIQKDLGIYALEESFEKYLVERMQRREGVIIKIDENPMWEERAAFLQEMSNINDLSFISLSNYKNLNILPFGQNKVLKDENLSKQFEVARDLLKSMIMKERKASEVFDVEKMAFYNAFCNLVGANHALAAHNWRLYYNPITSRLEPIGFDGNAGTKHYNIKMLEWGRQDEKYMAAYAKALEMVISDDFFEEVENFEGLDRWVETLQIEFPAYQWKIKNLKHNRASIKYRIFPPKCLNIFFENMKDNEVRLSMENYGSFPVEIVDLKYEEKRSMALPDEKTILLPGVRKEVTFNLDKNFQKLFVSKKKKTTQFSIEKNLEKIEVSWRTIGTSKMRTEEILPWKMEAGRPLAPEELHNPPTEVRKFDFLEIDTINKFATVKPGVWTVSKAIYIPSDYEFRISAGCKLDMLNGNAKIISFGPVKWIGTKENPIKIYSNSKIGSGIFVLNCKDTSIINQVIFDDLNTPKRNNWTLTGAVNFYNAPVKITNTIFKNNHSEDALNIIRSYFEMDNVHFSNTRSDAFDGDFAEGWIKNSTFRDLGNDGIDVSGSNILVENTLIADARDKGLSGGEKSTIIAKNVLIQSSEIAVASKDLSKIEITKMVLDNNKLGFTAFQKKPEFGASHIIASEVKMKENTMDYLIEDGSYLMLNGKKVATDSEVLRRMYGEEFGKKSQ